MIAALYVAENGPYFGLPDVDPWPLARDARKYRGPWPVVAHPECKRWGRYWSGGPSAKRRFKLGDDGGQFLAALAAVRRFGGVLEHPADSHAFRIFGLGAPPRDGGWVAAGDFIGWVCHVEQGHYGHPARKATWLYAVGVDDLPSLRWGPCSGRRRIDDGYHTAEERRVACKRARAREAHLPTRPDLDARALPRPAPQYRPFEHLPRSTRHLTPPKFRDELIAIARGARVTRPGTSPGRT